MWRLSRSQPIIQQIRLDSNLIPSLFHVVYLTTRLSRHKERRLNVLGPVSHFCPSGVPVVNCASLVLTIKVKVKSSHHPSGRRRLLRGPLNKPSLRKSFCSYWPFGDGVFGFQVSEGSAVESVGSETFSGGL